MILVDYSFIGISSVVREVSKTGEADEAFLKHLILNSIRGINKMFGPYFGDMIVACDSGGSWRRELFPEYKANRATGRKKSKIDWDLIYKACDDIQTVLRELFPVWVSKIHSCEADDIIAAFARKISEPIIIISKDKDFKQLLKFPNIVLYAKGTGVFTVNEHLDKKTFEWLEKMFDHNKYKINIVKSDFADDFLKEHIIRGDSSDGVPNCLSADDAFSNLDKRQTVMSKNRFARLFTGINISEQEKIYMHRNQLMIDLINYPIRCPEVIKQYNDIERGGNAITVQKWLIESSLLQLAGKVSDFFTTKTVTPNLTQFFSNFK